jgi:hypothetical protein
VTACAGAGPAASQPIQATGLPQELAQLAAAAAAGGNAGGGAGNNAAALAAQLAASGGAERLLAALAALPKACVFLPRLIMTCLLCSMWLDMHVSPR